MFGWEPNLSGGWRHLVGLPRGGHGLMKHTTTCTELIWPGMVRVRHGQQGEGTSGHGQGQREVMAVGRESEDDEEMRNTCVRPRDVE